MTAEPLRLIRFLMASLCLLKISQRGRVRFACLKRKEPEGAKTSKNLTEDAVLTGQNIDPDSIPRNASATPPVKLASEVIAAGNEVHLHGKKEKGKDVRWALATRLLHWDNWVGPVYSFLQCGSTDREATAP